MIFTQIPEKLKYEPSVRGRLSSMHSDLIIEVSKTYTGRFQDRKNAIKAMNVASYLLLTGDSSVYDWDPCKFIKDVPHIPDELCRSSLGKMYIPLKDVVWDIDIVSPTDSEVSTTSQILTDTEIRNQYENKFKKLSEYSDSKTEEVGQIIVPTNKSDLYLQPPTIPKFDYTKVWISKVIGGTTYCIYESLPKIPVKQNQISVTTDVSLMTYEDIRKLYPNVFIKTRPNCMYEHVPGIYYHNLLGCVIPIKGFTREQVIDNIIRYPHIFRLTRNVHGDSINFYSSIEVDGELYPISEFWGELEESASIPYNVDFVKEYVVRRYLLERDIKHIKHNYPVVEQFNAFLTLFMPISNYIEFGYTDIETIGRTCVNSRVLYKRSKNPVMRRIEESNV